MKLETYIASQGLTQKQFGDLVNASQSTISRICEGKVAPSFKLLKKIIEATGGDVSVEDLPDVEAQESGAAA